MERLKELRLENGLLQKDVAMIIGVDRTTYVKYERGSSEPPYEALTALADFYETTVDYLLGRSNDRIDYENDGALIASLNPALLEAQGGNVKKALEAQRLIDEEAMAESARAEGQAPRKGIKIPVLGRVAAGIPLEAVEDIVDYEEITPEMAASGEHFGLNIQGDSMAPRICSGDVVIVRKQESVENGDVAVVLINGQDATVKRFYATEHGIKLVAANPAYEPMFFSPEEIRSLPVTVIGRVVELRGKF